MPLDDQGKCVEGGDNVLCIQEARKRQTIETVAVNYSAQ